MINELFNILKVYVLLPFIIPDNSLNEYMKGDFI